MWFIDSSPASLIDRRYEARQIQVSGDLLQLEVQVQRGDGAKVSIIVAHKPAQRKTDEAKHVPNLYKHQGKEFFANTRMEGAGM